MKKNYIFKFLILLSIFTFSIIEAQYSGSGTFSKITSIANLSDGYYVITDEADTKVMTNSHNGKLFSPIDIQLNSDGKIENPSQNIVWKIETNNSGRTIYSEDTQKYVSYTGSKNTIQAVDGVTSDNQRWEFAYTSSKFVVTNKEVTNRILQYNSSAPRFVCYKSSQKKLNLYKLETVASLNPTISFENISTSVNESNTDQSIDIPITMSNYDGNNVDLSVTVSSNSTAEAADYTLSTTSLSFTGNGTKNISLTIKDDVDFDDETIVLEVSETSSTGTLNSNLQHSITILDDETPPVILEFKNPDFENWISGKPEYWSKAEHVTQETNPINVHSGTSSVKIVSGSSTRDLGQTITGIIPGREYHLSLWYKVESGDGTSARIWSYWKDSSNSNINDSNTDDLIRGPQNGYFDNAGNEWAKYEVTIKAPSNADSFYFEVRVYSGATVYYDDFKFDLLNTWTGAVDSSWKNSANWEANQIPTSSDVVMIPVLSGTSINYPTINSSSLNQEKAIAKSITIKSGASLIDKEGNLSDQNVPVTYNRVINDTKWHFISSPVTGVKIQDFMKNDLASGNNDHRGLGVYNTLNAKWSYYKSGYSSNDEFKVKEGYSIKLANPSEISFTGNLNDINTTPVVNSSSFASSNDNKYFLLGNPYTASIRLGDFLQSELNSLTTALKEYTIWVWNGDSYEEKLQGTDSDYLITPTQGFFVRAYGDNAEISFDYSKLVHQTSTFMRNDRMQLNLFVTDNEGNRRKTRIFYLDNVTKGLDHGYDGSLFSNNSDDLKIFTHLVDGNKNINLGTQSLPKDDIENVIVPLVLDAKTGSELIVSSESMNLPSGASVYLEDKVTGKITNLSSENYKVTLSDSINGKDRFYVYVTAKALDVDEYEKSDVSVFVKNSVVFVNGLKSSNAILEVFNISGSKLFSKKVVSNEILLPKLSTGVYVIKVSSESGIVTKKIIID